MLSFTHLKRWWRICCIALVTILAIAFSHLQPATAQQKPTLLISAGAGLQPVLEQIKRVYQQNQPNVNITYNYGSSGSLQRQIEQGAKTDIFISATSHFMNPLEKQGLLLANSRKKLLRNEIALVTSKDSVTISTFQDLTKPFVKKIAVGEPRSVPIGKSAQEIFNYFKIYDQVKSKLVYGRNGPQVLNYVETGLVDAAIVHDSNAQASNKVKIVQIAPEKSYTPVVYEVAILKNSKNISASQNFVNFLFTQPVKSLFEKYGYKMAS